MTIEDYTLKLCPIPGPSGFESRVTDWAEELLNHSRAAEDGLVNGKQVLRLWADFLKSGRSPRLLWNVLMLEQWYRGGNES